QLSWSVSMEHSALRLRLLFTFLAMLMIAASGAREIHGQFGGPGEPYFSLSSNRTFNTGQQPVVHLYASNVNSLEFRVYLVKDALEFFKGLQDYHRFGEQAPRPVQDQTLVERYHRLKQDLRFRIQNMFRAQYTKQSRAVIRDRMTKNATPKPVNANL